MAWQPPTQNNQPQDKVLYSWFNDQADRDLYLKERADTVDSYINQGVKTTSSPTFADVIITGLGAIKSMIATLNSRVNQALNTTSSPTFSGLTTGAITCSTVNTGQGTTEVYPMNQGVKTTDSVTFSGLNLNDTFMPTSSPTQTYGSLGNNVEYLVPKGIYMISTDDVEIYMAHSSAFGGWTRLGYGPGQGNGLIISNGSNLKLIGDTSLVGYYYLSKY